MDDFSWFGDNDDSVGSVGDQLWGSDSGGGDNSWTGLQMGDSPAPDSDWASTGGDGDWTNPSTGTTSGTGSFPWTQALLSGGGAVLQGLASEYKDKEDWKARTDYMKAQLAEQEKYYQLHGQQLEDAYSNYKQFAKPAGTPSATAQFGLLAGNGGVSGYFH